MGKLFLCGKFDIFKCAQGEEAVISSFGYTYYTDGNMRTKTETLLNNTSVTAYAYDGAGRLVSETTDGDTISYTYDARGNRVSMNNAGTVTTYTYDANNRLLTETTGSETTTYTYNKNGNMLTAGDKRYTYDVLGQQYRYTDGDVNAVYAYGGNGLRMGKSVGDETTYFVYDGMNIVYEYNFSGTKDTLYYYGLNRTHNSDGEIYVYNAHGDVIQLVKNNAVVVSYTYDAFGNITEQIGTSENPFLYCGEYFDAETGTYYLRARYYNPAIGRFIQQDAWGYMDASDPLSLNLYTYCNNNPVMYVDPNGHWLLPALAIGGILLAALTSCSDNNAGTINSEFYDPKSPMYDGGFWTYEEALECGFENIYHGAFGEHGFSEEERGLFIYSKEVINLSGELQNRYYAGRNYVAPVRGAEPNTSVYYLPKNLDADATVIAFIHTHNHHRNIEDEGIFSTFDKKCPAPRKYVIDNLGHMYEYIEDGSEYGKEEYLGMLPSIQRR